MYNNCEVRGSIHDYDEQFQAIDESQIGNFIS